MIIEINGLAVGSIQTLTIDYTLNIEVTSGLTSKITANMVYNV